MQQPLPESPIIWATAASALASLLSTVVSYVATRGVQRAKLQATEESTFQAVITSDSIQELGKYLDNVLGRFDVGEYASNATARHRVDSYIDRIQEFVGTVDLQKIEGLPTGPPPPPATTVQPLPSPFQGLIEEVQTGEPWNALARLRRHLEIRLKAIAEAADVAVPDRPSAGRILYTLSRYGRIAPERAQQLAFAIRTANRAIHGEDVSPQDAEQAIRQAAVALVEEPGASLAREHGV